MAGERDLFRRALACWGDESQWRMVQEECAELIAAVNRCDRGRCTVYDLAAEVADVEIMVAQARLLLGNSLVDDAKTKALIRLRARVEEAEKKAKDTPRSAAEGGE